MEEVKVPHHLFEAVQCELAEGEQVKWIGQPTPVLAAQSAKSECLGGLFMTVFASGWTWFVYQSTLKSEGGNVSFMLVFGIWFLGSGLYTVMAPLRAYWLAGHTVYAVTNLRAFSVVTFIRRTVLSFSRDRLATHERQEDAESRGSIIFYRVATQRSKGGAVYRDVGFMGLPNVREVSKVLVEVCEGAKSNALA